MRVVWWVVGATNANTLVDGGRAHGQREAQCDAGALAGGGGDQQPAAQGREAAAETALAVARPRFVRVEANAVILDHHYQVGGLTAHAQEHFGGAGVLGGVVKSLLDGQEHLVAGARGQRGGRKVFGDIEAAANGGGREELLSVFAKIVGQCRDGVLFGADGPNDLVEGAGQGTQSADQAGGRLRGGRCCQGLAFEGFAGQQRLGEPGPEVVVKVGGNALALAVDGALLFQLGHAAAQPGQRVKPLP